MPIGDPTHCIRTPGCYMGVNHPMSVRCQTYQPVQTLYPLQSYDYQMILNRNYQLEVEVEKLKKEKNASATRAKELLNAETGAYEIPLEKPGYIEYDVPDDTEETEPRAYSAADYPTSGHTATLEVKMKQNRPGTPGSFSWGPQTKQDYEATEEHRRTNYGEYVRKERTVKKPKVEMVTVFEVDPDLDVWNAIETGKAVECSLRVMED